MFSRNRETHHESGTTRSEYDPSSTASSLCFAYPVTRTRQDFQRNHQPAEAGRGINISGVDFWHAVEFSRNGRFLCTHPQNIFWGFPPGASLRSCVSDSIRLFRVRFPVEAGQAIFAFQFFAFAFPFPAAPTLSNLFRPPD